MVIATQLCSFSRLVPRGFEETLTVLRSALHHEGFEILCEVPFHREFQKSMGMTCRRCTVLVVWSQFDTWRAALTEDDAGLLMPFNIAVVEHGEATLVAVGNWSSRHLARATVGISLMLYKVRARMCRVFARCDTHLMEVEAQPLS